MARMWDETKNVKDLFSGIGLKRTETKVRSVFRHYGRDYKEFDGVAISLNLTDAEVEEKIVPHLDTILASEGLAGCIDVTRYIYLNKQTGEEASYYILRHSWKERGKLRTVDLTKEDD